MLANRRNGCIIVIYPADAKKFLCDSNYRGSKRNRRAAGAPKLVFNPSSLAERRLQIGAELVDIGFVDHFGWDDDQLVGRNARFVAFEIGGHQLHAAVSPLERLLHHRAGKTSLSDRAQRDRVLIERDYGDLPELAGRLQ